MKRLFGIIFTFVLLAFVFVVAATEYRTERAKELAKESAKTDLMTNSYECIRVSLLPTEDFSTGYIEVFDGITTKEVSYEFTSPMELFSFLEEVFAYQFDLGQIYLYLDPIELQEKKATAKDGDEQFHQTYLTGLFSLYSETNFICILPAYSASYWKGLQEVLEQKEQYLVDFVDLVSAYPNVATYYLGYEEWLITNPGNYVDTRMNNQEIHALLTGFVMRDEQYLLTKENVEEKLERTREVSEKELFEKDLPEQYTDLSKIDVVLIGDSIFGNYVDSASIAGVIEGFTDANVYICAQGGATAAPTKEFSFDFRDMVKRLLENDVEDMDECTFKKGVEKYDKYSRAKREKVFVINFGINDYFRGVSIKDFEASLQNGLQLLKEEYPDATYIVMGANYITMYENGTVLHNEETQGLISYVEAARNVAEEEGAIFLDNYSYFQEASEDVDDLLADRTHPNEYGRYLIGKRIVETICNVSK